MENQGWFFNQKVATLIIGALSFVVAFALNSTVQAAFREHVSELDKTEAWLIYTVIIFFVAIIVINLLWIYL